MRLIIIGLTKDYYRLVLIILLSFIATWVYLIKLYYLNRMINLEKINLPLALQRLFSLLCGWRADREVHRPFYLNLNFTVICSNESITAY